MQFTIWLTYECNLRCSYCYEGKEKGQDRMSVGTAKQVLKFINNKITHIHNNIMILFHGGEPLMNYDILKYMINEIKRWNNDCISLYLTTNALLLNDDRISYLTSNLDELSISIDGKERIHNLNRKFPDGSGSYQLIIENVKKIFNQNKCNVIARMTLTPETGKYLFENIKFLVGLGAKKILPAIDQFNSNWNEVSIDEVLSEVKKVYDELYILKEEYSIGIIEDLKYRRESSCMAGEQTMHISPNGEIYPCAYVMNVSRFELGNVEIGINEEKLKNLKEINEKNIKKCNKCSWNYMCHGTRCKLLNYAITKDFYQPAFSTCMYEHLLLKVKNYCKSKQD